MFKKIEKRKVNISAQDYEYTLRRRARVKYLRLSIEHDGTLVLTDEGYKITKKLLGVELREYKAADTADLSKELLPAFKKLADKYGAKIPVY